MIVNLATDERRIHTDSIISDLCLSALICGFSILTESSTLTCHTDSLINKSEGY